MNRARRSVDGRAVTNRWFQQLVQETREPVVVNDLAAWTEARGTGDDFLAMSGEPPKSLVAVPLVVAGDAFGRISLQNIDRTDAFGDG